MRIENTQHLLCMIDSPQERRSSFVRLAMVDTQCIRYPGSHDRVARDDRGLQNFSRLAQAGDVCATSRLVKVVAIPVLN